MYVVVGGAVDTIAKVDGWKVLGRIRGVCGDGQGAECKWEEKSGKIHDCRL